MKNTLLIITLLLSTLPVLSAERTDSTIVFFHQGKAGIISGYKGNGERLDSLITHIKDSKSKGRNDIIKKVRVVGSASPEGSVGINYRLSDQRGERIFDYVSREINIPDTNVSFSYTGRDWPGLLEMVKGDPGVPYKSEVESLLEGIVSQTASGEKESFHTLQRVKDVRNGIPYRYMYQRMFPALRYSTIYIDFENERIPMVSGMTPELKIPATRIEVPEILESSGYVGGGKLCKPFYMALKTNLLYDALALPNIGAEFYLGKNWSIVGNWTYGWWDTDRKHRYWRAYGGDLAVRRWFGKQAAEKPLTGHHLGIYGGVMTYDFEFGGKGYMGGKPHGSLWDRCNYFGGIEYGYSLPIARRLNIDFTLGIGYMGGKYLEYIPKDGRYIWQSTHKLRWFGPTKAEISLVWLIGCGNYNIKKGGAR